MKDKNVKKLLIVLVVLMCIIALAAFLLFSLLYNTNGRVYDLEQKLIQKDIWDTKYVYITPTAVPNSPTPEPTLNITPTPYITAQPVLEAENYKFDFDKRVDANPYIMKVQLYMDANEAQEILGYPSKIEQREMPEEGIGGIRTICTYSFGRVEYNSDTMDYLSDGSVMSVIITEENHAGINGIEVGDDIYAVFSALGLDEDMMNSQDSSFNITNSLYAYLYGWNEDENIRILDILCSDYNHILLSFAFENDKVIEIILTHEYY